MIEIQQPGMLSSLQDTGRQGLAHLGIGRAGAADLPALRLANALVGNAPDACAIEMTLQGPTVRLHERVRIALTGAPLPQARVDDQPLPMWQVCELAAGSTLTLGGMPHGCRSYLAVAGGIQVQPQLGSRSCDLNAGVGPLQGRALRKGDRLQTGPSNVVGSDPARPWSVDPRPWFEADGAWVLRLLRGRHSDLLDDDAARALTHQVFTVQADSNRVGIRLQGPELRLREPVEMVSEGSVAGVVQLPPGGQPILLGCEHPVTGGYPRIAQVAEVDLPRLGQLRPGDEVRFCWIGLDEALGALHEQQRTLHKLEADIARRLGTI